jgi:hypothetical protein
MGAPRKLSLPPSDVGQRKERTHVAAGVDPMRTLKHWANVINWTLGLLLSIATPATADVFTAIFV